MTDLCPPPARPRLQADKLNVKGRLAAKDAEAQAKRDGPAKPAEGKAASVA